MINIFYRDENCVRLQGSTHVVWVVRNNSGWDFQWQTKSGKLNYHRKNVEDVIGLLHILVQESEQPEPIDWKHVWLYLRLIDAEMGFDGLSNSVLDLTTSPPTIRKIDYVRQETE